MPRLLRDENAFALRRFLCLVLENFADFGHILFQILDTSGRCLDSWEGHCDGTVHAIGWFADFLVTGSALGKKFSYSAKDRKYFINIFNTSVHF